MTDPFVTITNNGKSITVMDGFRFAAGVGTYIATAGLILIVAANFVPGNFDDSDNPPVRSGMRIKTDALTGCQYLLSFTGSLVPRMGGDGRQVCKRP